MCDVCVHSKDNYHLCFAFEQKMQSIIANSFRNKKMLTFYTTIDIGNEAWNN